MQTHTQTLDTLLHVCVLKSGHLTNQNTSLSGHLTNRDTPLIRTLSSVRNSVIISIRSYRIAFKIETNGTPYYATLHLVVLPKINFGPNIKSIFCVDFAKKSNRLSVQIFSQFCQKIDSIFCLNIALILLKIKLILSFLFPTDTK